MHFRFANHLLLGAGGRCCGWEVPRAARALVQGLATLVSCPTAPAGSSLTSSPALPPPSSWPGPALRRQAHAVHTSALQGVCHSKLAYQHAQPEEVDTGDRNARSSSGGPLALYSQRREAGLYRPDPRQELTTAMLQELWDNLHTGGVQRPRKNRSMPSSGLTMVDAYQQGAPYGHHHLTHKHAGKPHVSSSRHATGQKTGGFWSGVTSLLGGRDAGTTGPVAPLHPGPHVNGLYMYGGVGVGKTMLMDVFVGTATPEMQVLRTHFHDFMLVVHDKLQQYKGDADPLLRVADSIAKRSHVLALDEFFVTDVADAMILSRLFGRLWDRGVVLVATSNRHPDKLYENGLQRALFLPFIARLKAECQVHDMASTTDYRRLAHHQRGLYFVTGDRERDLHDEWLDCAEGAPVQAVPLDVRMGRTITVQQAAGSCAMMTFEELCGRPVAAADYLAITERFNTLAVSGVPVFTGANRSSGYRFVTLIDIMYEHRMRMLISADASPFDLFQHVVTQADVSADPSLKKKPDIIVDDNLGFAKDRTISRLLEMQSLEYLVAYAKLHNPQNLLALEEAQAKAKAAGHN